MLLMTLAVGGISYGITIQSNIDNAVGVLRSFFITIDGKEPTSSNTVV